MKILSFLTILKEVKASASAKRKARSLKRNQEALINNLEGELEALLDKKESLLDLSENDISTTWNKDFHDVIINIEILTNRVRIAKSTLEEYFTTKED